MPLAAALLQGLVEGDRKYPDGPLTRVTVRAAAVGCRGGGAPCGQELVVPRRDAAAQPLGVVMRSA